MGQAISHYSAFSKEEQKIGAYLKERTNVDFAMDCGDEKENQSINSNSTSIIRKP
jgi:hypothetical protein